MSMSSEKGLVGQIFNIQRFSLNDGPGVRTTVFMKGCPLHCIWCHNPESQRMESELMFDRRKCVSCGSCENTCQNHHIVTSNHIFNRNACMACGRCADICPTKALTVSGRKMTIEEVLKESIRDRVFFRENGGVTLSGGEPFSQSAFLIELLKRYRVAGIHTAIETSGHCSWEKLEQAAPLTDMFLYDIKETDSEKHRTYTGASNQLILKNLFMLDEINAVIRLRCPIIPGYNDREEHFRAIGKLADELVHVERVEVEPYHPLGKSKAEQLGREYLLGDLPFPSGESVISWIHCIQKSTNKPVVRA